jgi:SAM-dependent methyltransferase
MQSRAYLHLDRARADSFGAAARVYDARRPRYPVQLIDDLLMQGARTALDVGAGTGILSEQLLEKGVDVLAVEPDPRMAEVARRKAIPIEIGTFENWDAAQRRFDLVVFGSSFHWVNPDVGLPKAHRLLPSGGRLALIWNRVVPIHPTRSDLAEIYQGYMDPGSHLVDGSSNGPIDTEHRTDGLIVSITASGFTVEERTYPREDHYSTEQWLDLAFTYSSHLVLDAEKASELRTKLAERIGANGVSVGGDTLLILATRI